MFDHFSIFCKEGLITKENNKLIDKSEYQNLQDLEGTTKL